MDLELLNRARKGDRMAFGELYDRHHAVVWRFVVHRMNSNPQAEDIVHDTFMELLKHLDRYNPERGAAFDTFLCSIADKLILKHRRKLEREVPFETLEQPEPPVFNSPSGHFEQQANQTLDVQKATETLPERQREVLRLKDAEEFSLQEIVETVGTTLPAVKALLFRAREGVKRFLNPAHQKKDV
ncbi:MAG: RNA polymerase sigma factor [Blastocatellia bacterium]|nr:RNA polymerase sigma factor [Blastocatellia bacterium]